MWDVERYRRLPRRTVVVRRARRTMVVLGSTQPDSVVEWAAAGSGGIEIWRRRSGGGAVLVAPGDPVWLDLWIPRGDALWDQDVTRSAQWVGEWWAGALRAVLPSAPTGLAVHQACSDPTGWARLVCFGGLGPGEVSVSGRKLVGVAQWRCREGALFHCAAYGHWDPGALLRVMRTPPGGEPAAPLAGAAVGFETLGIDRAELLAALLEALPAPDPWVEGLPE